MFAAFAVSWVVFFLYAWFLNRRQQEMSKEIRGLRQALDFVEAVKQVDDYVHCWTLELHWALLNEWEVVLSEHRKPPKLVPRNGIGYVTGMTCPAGFNNSMDQRRGYWGLEARRPPKARWAGSVFRWSNPGNAQVGVDAEGSGRYPGLLGTWELRCRTIPQARAPWLRALAVWLTAKNGRCVLLHQRGQ